MMLWACAATICTLLQSSFRSLSLETFVVAQGEFCRRVLELGW
jgi:hypothetical protein